MKLNIKFLFILFFGLQQLSNAQDCERIDIQNVTLKDSVLTHYLEGYIDTLNKNNALGYIWLRYSKDMSSPQDSGSIYKYSFYREGVGFDKYSESQFPKYFTVVKGRPVLISTTKEEYICYQFSSRSKRKFIKLIAPYLPPARKLVLKDVEGNKHIDDNFRPNSFFSLHGEWVLNFYKDKPPKLRRSTYRE